MSEPPQSPPSPPPPEEPVDPSVSPETARGEAASDKADVPRSADSDARANSGGAGGAPRASDVGANPAASAVVDSPASLSDASKTPSRIYLQEGSDKGAGGGSGGGGGGKVIEVEAAPVTGVPFLTRAGFVMALSVLATMGVIAFGIIYFAERDEREESPKEVASLEHLADLAVQDYLISKSPEVLKEANELANKVTAARKASRDFWVQIIQILLVNVFLPVLTSILGYMYGTSRAENSNTRMNG